MSTPTQNSAHLSCHPERSQSRAQRAIRVVEGPLRSFHTAALVVDRVRKVALAVLKEIFDESAYARFLTRNQLPVSRASYAAFRSEYELSKARRPKCC